MAERFEIVPIEGKSYEGRQWGWRVLRDGRPFLDCITGGTGSCWNITSWDLVSPEIGEPDDEIHVCELDEFIDALQTLHGSEAHRQNVARWAPPDSQEQGGEDG